MMIKYKHTQKLWLLCLFLWAATLSTPTVPARANGLFFVNSDTNIDMRDSFLTLREAIRVANGHLLGPFSAVEAAA